VTLNLESVILIENKLFRIAQNIKHIRLPTQSSPKQVIETYESTFTDLVDLCEDYWYILRIESSLFSKLPQKIFGKQDPLFVETLTRSFNL